MQVGMCVTKYKKNNVIVAYDIQLQDGRVVNFTSADLKAHLDANDLTIQNLIYAKNGRLLDYWSRDDLVIPKVVQVKAEQIEIPPVVYNEQTHKYRYKVRRVYKRPSKSNPYESFDLFDIQTGKFERCSAQKTLTLAKKSGVEGIAIVNDKIVNAEGLSTGFFADKSKVKVPYNVFWFFNRIQVELCDIPDQVYALAESEVKKTQFKHKLGLSRADYANNLANDYARIKEDFPPNAFLAILTNKPCKYTDLYKEYLHYDKIKHEDYLAVTPDSYCEKIRVLSGLPEWASPLIKYDLYNLW